MDTPDRAKAGNIYRVGGSLNWMTCDISQSENILPYLDSGLILSSLIMEKKT